MTLQENISDEDTCVIVNRRELYFQLLADRLKRDLDAARVEIARLTDLSYSTPPDPINPHGVTYQWLADRLANVLSGTDEDAERYLWLFHDGDVTTRYSAVYRQWDGCDGFDGWNAAVDRQMEKQP